MSFGVFCEHLMHVIKTVKHFFDSLSNYVLFMKSCPMHWVTTDLKGAGIGQSLYQLACGMNDQGTVDHILAGEQIFVVCAIST